MLPLLIESSDVSTLTAVAASAQQAETARLGAVEGLARMAMTAAEEQLVAIGKDDTNDEELRKAAWRGLRRSKRMRAKT